MINRALNQKTAWSDERAIAVSSLIEAAVASRAESFSLIPRVDGRETEDGLRQWILRETMREILQMLEGRNVLALIEPIGFASSSLKRKRLADGVRIEVPRHKLLDFACRPSLSDPG
jgi:predicted xylose isomerase-like sugar epimerase